MKNQWTKWTEKVVKEAHGDIQMYRDLYDGNHAQIFERARDLIEKGEITDQIIYGERIAKNVKTPYLMANVSKMIVDIPAMLVSRAMGHVSSSANTDDFEGGAVDDEGNPVDPVEMQKDIIKGIAKRSNLMLEHKTNIIHHQMDGGIVGVPFDSDNGVRIDFKSRDVYYPHSDGLGADLVYEMEIDNEDDDESDYDHYLHVYSERWEGPDLETEHMLFDLSESGDLQPIDDEEMVKEILGLEELRRTYTGRDRSFILYWANNKTFHNPLGTSELRNMAGKQDEVNWTLTRNGIVYERNGKPRLAVSEEIFKALQDKAHERYGDESKIDHRDLEIMTFDSNGKAMEVIQIDITKIGDIKYVKDLMKIMLMETHTSEKAIDFYMESGSGAQSGIAKFYDLFTSIMKAESILEEYVAFLQGLFENALWIANQDDPTVLVEEPRFQIKNMMPIARKELIEQEGTAYKNATQSLETTVRNQNPTASDEWIEDEMDKIDDEQSSVAPVSGGFQARQTLSGLLDNRNPNGSIQGENGGDPSDE